MLGNKSDRRSKYSQNKLYSKNKLARLVLVVVSTVIVGLIMAGLFVRLGSGYQRTLLYALALGFMVVAGYIAGKDSTNKDTTGSNSGKTVQTSYKDEAKSGYGANSYSSNGYDVNGIPDSQSQQSIMSNDKVEYLRKTLTEISSMQASNDLFDRYQYFLNLVDDILNEALGPCSVTMWCPDEKRENLIECVIVPEHQYSEHASALYNQMEMKPHVPCKIPLSSEVVIRCLKTAKPYLADSSLYNAATVRPVGNSRDRALHCDGCIALYRKYGQPLLINIEREYNQQVKSRNSDYTGKTNDKQERERFDSAARLINIFWQQLQVANQREWIIEHDEFSGALRDDKFIHKAKNMAELCRRRDEPFALVVITVRGFRRMFAGQSEQWKNLSGLFGMTLRDILKEKKKEFLLGKMSDDVFALMLAYADEFLAWNIMDSIAGQLGEAISNNKDILKLDIMALDIQWAIADHRYYSDGPAETLNRIYQQLFDRNEQQKVYSYQIILNRNGQGQEVLCR